MTFFRFLLVASVSLLCASQVTAQEATEGSVASELDSMLERVETAEITPIRTESPRNTLQSLYQLRHDLETSWAHTGGRVPAHGVGGRARSPRRSAARGRR